MDNQITPRPTDPQPFFETLQEEMERMIDRMRFSPTIRGTASRLGLSGQMMPAIDMSESDDMVEITVEVPGVDKDNIDVTINGDVLTVKGEKSNDREESDKSYHLIERSYGHFERRVPLGFVPDDDAVTAAFDAGVLKLQIRKPAEVKAAVRKVKISGT